MSQAPEVGRSLFINCPYDDDYRSLLRPLLFSVVYLGFNPRLAADTSDSGHNRLDKIAELIRGCRSSIHDISRLRAAAPGDYARFNLPFELGLDYGARRFGGKSLRQKKCLILEAEPHAYIRALSDLAGIDIKSHGNHPATLVRAVRDWSVETVGLSPEEGPTGIWNMFMDFAAAFYDSQSARGFSGDDLDFMPIPEYVGAIKRWLAGRPNNS